MRTMVRLSFCNRPFTVLVLFCAIASGLDNGAAPTPPMGWSSWMAFRFNVSATKLMRMADLMVSSGLRDAGYVYLLLDDGWPTCSLHNSDGGCSIPAPRDAQGRIVPDPAKFPDGMKAVADYVHASGLKLGIYTAPHKQTCGGYTGSLGHEAVDAQTFADWGIDFAKLDAGCRMDCSIHDGCLLTSLTAMRDGLNATGRRIVYYIDDGNPTSGPKVYNPYRRSWPDNEFTRTHIATSWSEFVCSWGPDMANMWKIWFDRWDGWQSLLDNTHQQVGMQWFQSANAFNNPDFMTVGQGGMTQGQYRAEVFLYATLGAPLIVSFDLESIDNFTRSLVLNPEIIAVDQDPDCVQGTNVDAYSAADIWIKPLHDGSFAATLINKDPMNAQVISLRLGYIDGDTDSSDEDFFPAGPFKRAKVRDLYARQDLGVFEQMFNATVPPMDAVFVRVFPTF
eukprot:TRINITY_DN1661_c0_g1_i4.p1 TRINITY_DN1661_c0_g1~~TRINITY_DN1661_c0_g1_i4.p1  ORF type:complete len:450 (-),score=144.81 TRINITY_DN1661_c0_g1_i4:76-1425(-)